MSRFRSFSLATVAVAALLAGCPKTGKTPDGKETPMDAEATAFMKECRGHLEASGKILEEILSMKSADSKAAADATAVLDRFNRMSVELDTAGASASLIANVHPKKSLREAAELCEQEVSQFATELSLNRDLYEVFAGVKPDALDPLAKRLHSKTMLDFRRAGVDKDEATRDKIKKLKEELVQIGQEFGRNIREDVRYIELDSNEDLAGLPDDYVEAHKPGENGKIRITTDYPDYIPFMHYAENNEARKQLSYEFKNRGYPANIEVLNKMLAKRYELAKLLGYPNWADYVTEDKMIRSADAVEKFVDNVAKIAEIRAQREYQMLLAEKQKTHPKAEAIEDWEKTFYEERVKEEKFKFDSLSVRPYFEYNHVKAGLLELTSELYGIRYEPVKDAEVWHESVDVYDVYDGDKKLGRIYLDMHPRENKYKHAAQFTLKSGVDDTQMPEGVLVCNFPDPSKTDGPALMDHDQVVTFFHEFGHLLHHVLGGHQPWVRFSGVATEWDFVEAPSQFFEEWAWDPDVLSRFAKHYETNKPIPHELVEKMRRADEFGQGMAARQQMFYAALSLNYYNQDPSKFDTTELLKTMQSKYSMFPYMDDTHFQANFGHLDGYSAMYYTYMWSLVISKDLLSPFKEKGMLNTKLAQRYRKTVLEPGGSKDAADLVEDFLGRPYSFEAFRHWLEGEGT